MNALRYLPFLARGLRHSGPPLHLTLFVTGACNLRCRHCFHWQEVAASVPGPSLEQVQKLADSSARLGPLLWVAFGGGEPFLRRDLPDLATAFARHGLRHLSIPTNGLVERQHASIERIVTENPGLFLNVSVSIDGPPDIHDEIRQVKGGHRRSIEAVRELQRQARALATDSMGAPGGGSRLGVGLILTVTSENQHVLAEHMEELVRDVRPDNVTINLARDKALDAELLTVDLDRYADVVQKKQRLVAEGLLPYFDFPLAKVAVARDRMMYDHVERVARGDKSKHLPCTAGKLSAVVFEDGSVHPCEILGRSIGNLNEVDWDLARLWHANEAETLRREIKDTRCACTWECANADNVLFSPRKWPELAAKSLRG